MAVISDLVMAGDLAMCNTRECPNLATHKINSPTAASTWVTCSRCTMEARDLSIALRLAITIEPMSDEFVTLADENARISASLRAAQLQAKRNDLDRQSARIEMEKKKLIEKPKGPVTDNIQKPARTAEINPCHKMTTA